MRDNIWYSVFEFDNGRYQLYSQINSARGAWREAMYIRLMGKKFKIVQMNPVC